MSDEDMELVKAIRDSRRDQLVHEYLCPACAHRDHAQCDLQCQYCGIGCQCVCRRWAIPITGLDGR